MAFGGWRKGVGLSVFEEMDMNTNRKNVILALLVALALGAAFVSASVTSQAQNAPPAQEK